MKSRPSSFILHPSSSHVLAWVVACATFPLIWMGGFVTTYRAGMAVPDWPTTYGYNMFLYPLESWLKVWDVFLEHSHRLVASSVGMLTIALAVVLWLSDQRHWVRWLGVAAVAGVSFQGVLGGLRVIADERFLAKVHGCTAPVFFALTASLVTFTSRKWRTSTPLAHSEAGGEEHETPLSRRAAGGEGQKDPRLSRCGRGAGGEGQRTPLARCGRGAGGEGVLPLAVTVIIYLQIVAGAQLRHLVPQERTLWFAVWVWIHLIVAGLAAAGVLWIAGRARRRCGRPPIVVRKARFLAGLMLLQLILGVATWVTNYGWPVWFTRHVWAMDYTVVAAGPWQAVLTTAHVAVASLVLVTALSLALWSLRLPAGNDRAPEPATLLLQ